MRHHTGSGRRHVFPTDWQTHHAAVVDDTLDCWVEIRSAEGIAGWDDVLQQTVTVKAPAVWAGWATVEPKVTTDGGGVYAADEQVPTRVYDVVASRCLVTATPHLVVDVVSSPDPMLVGGRLSIDSVERGSRMFSRGIVATLNQ